MTLCPHRPAGYSPEHRWTAHGRATQSFRPLRQQPMWPYDARGGCRTSARSDYMGGTDVGSAFTVADFEQLSRLVLDAWRSGLDRDWSTPAGTLEWSCWKTADHTVDCVFSYALFLASRKQDAYPNFGELHALPDATPADILDGLRAVTTMLAAVIVTAPPEARAVIQEWPRVEAGTPQDFAARGALEMTLHAHDVCSGLGVRFEPPQDLCQRLRDHTRGWSGSVPIEPTGDAWSDLLEQSGRPRSP